MLHGWWASRDVTLFWEECAVLMGPKYCCDGLHASEGTQGLAVEAKSVSE
jgi:hypothetical protein